MAAVAGNSAVARAGRRTRAIGRTAMEMTKSTGMTDLLRWELARWDCRSGSVAVAAVALLKLSLGCGTTATPVRSGDFPVAGTTYDVRPDPVVDQVALKRGDNPDQATMFAVRRGLNELMGSAAVGLDVSVREGTAAISGQVANPAQHALALETARAVIGVTAVEDRIRVVKVVRSDTELEREIADGLADSLPDDWPQIRIEVRDGIAWLSGQARSAAASDFVAEQVERVSGVAKVMNQLRVPMVDGLSKEKLRKRVESRLQNVTAAARLSVKIQDGVASVAGVVPSFGQRRRVIAAAAEPGIGRVNAERLQVAWKRPSERSSPPQVTKGSETARAQAPGGNVGLAEQIVAALRRDPYLDSRQIAVRVSDGLVQLTGTVDAAFERERASAVAAQVAGIIEVINDLDVVPAAGRMAPAP